MDFYAAAAGWDTDRRTKRAKIISDEIAKSISFKPHSNALEFGCGTGLISFGLMDKFAHITLADTSEAMINMTDSKISDAGITNMTALYADILSMAGSDREELQKVLPHKKYDVIYMSMVLHHVSDVESAVTTFYDLLSGGGTICIVDLSKDDGSFHRLEKDFTGHNGFEQNELKAVLEDNGFADVHTKIFYEDVKKVEDRDVPYSLFIITGTKPIGEG